MSKHMKTQTKALNILLASLSVASSNAKSYHWYIKGDNFFFLHEKFGELYEFLVKTVDQVGERILGIKQEPMVNFSNYLNHSIVLEATVRGEKEILQNVLSDLALLIGCAKEAREESVKAEDDETDSYLQELVFQLQKLEWQYNSQNSQK